MRCPAAHTGMHSFWSTPFPWSTALHTATPCPRPPSPRAGGIWTSSPLPGDRIPTGGLQRDCTLKPSPPVVGATSDHGHKANAPFISSPMTDEIMGLTSGMHKEAWGIDAPLSFERSTCKCKRRGWGRGLAGRCQCLWTVALCRGPPPAQVCVRNATEDIGLSVQMTPQPTVAREAGISAQMRH